jgi:receptor-type tyrosine-protein phosphatase F
LQELNREGDIVNDPFKVDVTNGDAEEFNVTDLQPDTEYSVQVAAVTRKGDGTRSRSERCRTQGGVPSRPFLQTQISVENEQTVDLQLSWARPNHTFGQLNGYRLRHGLIDGQLDRQKSVELPPEVTSYVVKEALKGARYEFRLAASNSIGWGQEAIVRFQTPEGVPRDSPQNVTYRLQSPTTVVLNWDAPLPAYRNGKIVGYAVQFYKPNEQPNESNTTQARMVYATLDENAEYVFRARAFTSKGAGPWAQELTVRTPGDVPPSPKNVQAMATSEHSVLVWWDEMAFFADILGYSVLYTQTPSEDLDLWAAKRVPLTGSAELSGLESNVMYAIRVAAYTKKGLGRLSEMLTVRTNPTDVPIDLRGHSITTHAMTLQWRAPRKLNPIGYSITYGANKQFVDAQGTFKVLVIPPTTFNVSHNVTEYTISGLIPFTSYEVNVTALPADTTFRPPARLIVTTSMAAPKPMAKPDLIATNGREIHVALPQASEEYGPISHYYLIVVSADYALKHTDPDHYNVGDLLHAPADSPAYIAAKFSRRTASFQLGNNQKNEGFLNRLLAKNGQYQIFVRAVVENQENLYTNSPFSPILSLQKSATTFVRSKENPQKNPIHEQLDPGGFLWLVAFILGTLLLSMCIVAILLVKRRGQLLKSPGQSVHQETTMKLLCANMPELEPLQPQPNIPSVPDPVEMRRMQYQTPAMMSHPQIPVTELSNHIDRLRENENELFSAEYESIDPSQQFTWEHSQNEINKSKNRYANVIAYDHSRVILQPIDGQPGSDYINANYCDGYRRANAYIATQGPLPETIGDFWRMVWEQRSTNVVMMTKLEERTRIKCDQYWPARGSESYGVMHVTLVNVEELSTYCIRTFVLQRAGFAEKREIRQFQFTAWPDHGVPDHPTPFLMFLRRVNALNAPDAGPMVIHCSAGVGRTGCFIVIDSMLQRLQHENTVDIYGHVTCLRAQRNYTVQTEDQYIFIYDAVLEAVQAGNTEILAGTLYGHLQQLLQLVPGENVSALDLEFRRLGSMKSSGTAKCIAGNLPVNRHKNRLLSILPFEMSRVCLQPLRGVEGSDYINASFIDGYRYRGAYIAAQAPLVDTCEDFWRMLWEHNSTIVVMLTKCAELGREKSHLYWPCERSVRHLYFVIEPVTEYNMSHYVLREFKMTDARDSQTRTVRQFHFVDWPEQGVPKSADAFLDFITQVHKTKEQFGQQGPITVHCSAGVGRTGAFICLSILLERLQNEGVLDLFQTVRTLRTQRPGMLQTEDQYQFCYRSALEYISTFDFAG